MNEKLLEIRELSVTFRMPDHAFEAVKGMSFDIARGQTVFLKQ